HAVHRILPLRPRDQLVESCLKGGGCLEFEHLAAAQWIPDAVADIAGAIAGNQHGSDVEPEPLREGRSDLRDRNGPAGAYIASLPHFVLTLYRLHYRTSHVGDMNEIPALLPVLEHERRLAVLRSEERRVGKECRSRGAEKLDR